MNHNITGLIIIVEILKETRKRNHGVILARMFGNIVICLKFLQRNVSYAYIVILHIGELKVLSQRYF